MWRRLSPSLALVLMSVLQASPAFELVIDARVRLDTDRLPRKVGASLFDTAANDTELSFTAWDEDGGLSQLGVVLGDVSRWQRSERMDFLRHVYRPQEVFDRLKDRLGLEALSEGMVSYRWSRNQVDVERSFIVFSVAGGPVSFLYDSYDSSPKKKARGQDMDALMVAVDMIEWLAPAETDAPSATRSDEGLALPDP